jgi:hypothetical protein
MLNIDIFDNFISVGARKGISKYASAILKEDYSSGMSGYDVEEMVKLVVQKNQTEDFNISKHFSFDSEYGMFCMYYKVDGETTLQITEETISKCTEFVTIINNFIKNEYINAVMGDLDTIPQVYHVNSSN